MAVQTDNPEFELLSLDFNLPPVSLEGYNATPAPKAAPSTPYSKNESTHAARNHAVVPESPDKFTGASDWKRARLLSSGKRRQRPKIKMLFQDKAVDEDDEFREPQDDTQSLDAMELCDNSTTLSANALPDDRPRKGRLSVGSASSKGKGAEADETAEPLLQQPGRLWPDSSRATHGTAVVAPHVPMSAKKPFSPVEKSEGTAPPSFSSLSSSTIASKQPPPSRSIDSRRAVADSPAGSGAKGGNSFAQSSSRQKVPVAVHLGEQPLHSASVPSAALQAVLHPGSNALHRTSADTYSAAKSASLRAPDSSWDNIPDPQMPTGVRLPALLQPSIAVLQASAFKKPHLDFRKSSTPGGQRPALTLEPLPTKGDSCTKTKTFASMLRVHRRLPSSFAPASAPQTPRLSALKGVTWAAGDAARQSLPAAGRPPTIDLTATDDEASQPFSDCQIRQQDAQTQQSRPSAASNWNSGNRETQHGRQQQRQTQSHGSFQTDSSAPYQNSAAIFESPQQAAAAAQSAWYSRLPHFCPVGAFQGGRNPRDNSQVFVDFRRQFSGMKRKAPKRGTAGRSGDAGNNFGNNGTGGRGYGYGASNGGGNGGGEYGNSGFCSGGAMGRGNVQGGAVGRSPQGGRDASMSTPAVTPTQQRGFWTTGAFGREFTTTDGKKLTGKHAYAAYRKEKERGADDGAHPGGGHIGGSHRNDVPTAEAETLRQTSAVSKTNAATKRKATPKTAPVAKKRAAAKRSSNGWDPQSRVTFDI